MTNKQLAERLLQNPNNEVYIIDYDKPVTQDLVPIVEVYNDEPGKTVLSTL